MAPIALEEVWATKRWPNRIFTYLLATTEVSCNLGESSFGEVPEPRPQLEFRRLLAKDLINNPYLEKEQDDSPNTRKSKRNRDTGGHELQHIPRGKKFSGARLVPAKSNYAFNFCSCRTKRVRTYCRCSPGVLFCSLCFVTHCNEADGAD